MQRLSVGQDAPSFELSDIRGAPVSLASLLGRPLLLQFHRFSDCPSCNFAVRQFAKRHADLVAAGLDLVMLFHSPAEVLASAMAAHEPPFCVLADPERKVYEAYGVERSVLGILAPAFLAQVTRGMFSSRVPRAFHGGIVGLPADFLLDQTGRLAHVHYGAHAADSLDVDHALALLESPTL